MIADTTDAKKIVYSMSTRALRKLQGGRKDLDLPNSCHEEEEDQEEDGDDDDKDEQLMKETLQLPSKGPNRFDLVSCVSFVATYLCVCGVSDSV